MKFRSDGVRLCVIGLALAALAMATPVCASVPPASQSEVAQSGEVFGIPLPPWFGSLWDLLRATAAGGGPSSDLDGHNLVDPEGDDQQLPSPEPSESNQTELGPGFEPDG